MKKSSKKKLWNIGFIGAGTMSRKHAADFLSSKRCTIGAVADVFEASAKSFAEMFNVPMITNSYKELLADPSIDAVVIGTPPGTHKQIFLDALKADKHILVEKPIGIATADLAAMTKAQSAKPKLVVIDGTGRHARLQPKYDFVKNLISAGTIGDVYHVHHVSVSRQSRPGVESNKAATWFVDKKLAGGGPSIDWGVYDLSFHLGVLGDKHNLKKVESMTKNGLDKIARTMPNFTVEEHFAAFLTFDKGLTYYWERATNANNEVPHQTRFYGTNGGLTLTYTSWEPPVVTLYDVDAKGKARTRQLKVPMLGHNDDNRPLVGHFLDCLDKKAKPIIPFAVAARNVGIILRVLAGK